MLLTQAVIGNFISLLTTRELSSRSTDLSMDNLASIALKVIVADGTASHLDATKDFYLAEFILLLTLLPAAYSDDIRLKVKRRLWLWPLSYISIYVYWRTAGDLNTIFKIALLLILQASLCLITKPYLLSIGIADWRLLGCLWLFYGRRITILLLFTSCLLIIAEACIEHTSKKLAAWRHGKQLVYTGQAASLPARETCRVKNTVSKQSSVATKKKYPLISRIYICLLLQYLLKITATILHQVSKQP